MVRAMVAPDIFVSEIPPLEKSIVGKSAQYFILHERSIIHEADEWQFRLFPRGHWPGSCAARQREKSHVASCPPRGPEVRKYRG